MTIGKRQSSVRGSIRAPKFLDKSSGFYGRLDEAEAPAAAPREAPDAPAAEQQCRAAVEDAEVFLEDDGETLLRRKPSRHSSRWRSLRRKEKSRGSEGPPEVIIQVQLQTPEKERDFPVPQEPDDQVLIRGHAEEPEEDRGRREQQEGLKALKRTSSKNYRKALDRALRRGWEAFITNLYSVTLTPATSATPEPSSPSAKKRQHSSVLAELH